MDTLCIGPSYATREVMQELRCFSGLLVLLILPLTFNFLWLKDFFYLLHNMLAEIEEVAELQPVPDAHVPVMKFKFDGISIDLLYASIDLLVVPDVSLC